MKPYKKLVKENKKELKEFGLDSYFMRFWPYLVKSSHGNGNIMADSLINLISEAMEKSNLQSSKHYQFWKEMRNQVQVLYRLHGDEEEFEDEQK